MSRTSIATLLIAKLLVGCGGGSVTIDEVPVSLQLPSGEVLSAAHDAWLIHNPYSNDCPYSLGSSVIISTTGPSYPIDVKPVQLNVYEGGENRESLEVEGPLRPVDDTPEAVEQFAEPVCTSLRMGVVVDAMVALSVPGEGVRRLRAANQVSLRVVD